MVQASQPDTDSSTGTELPWTATKAPDVGILIEAGHELIAIVDSECSDIDACDIADANADLIVRAVNNHAKLLKALELAEKNLRFFEHRRDDPVMRRIRTAIEEAQS